MEPPVLTFEGAIMEGLNSLEMLIVMIFVAIPVALFLSIPNLIEKYVIRGCTGRRLTIRLWIALTVYAAIFFSCGLGGGYYAWVRWHTEWWAAMLMPLLALGPVLLSILRLIRNAKSIDGRTNS